VCLQIIKAVLNRAAAGSTIIWDNQDNALRTATSGNPKQQLQTTVNSIQITLPQIKSKLVTMSTKSGEYT
jgi:hypothetical protein